MGDGGKDEHSVEVSDSSSPWDPSQAQQSGSTPYVRGIWLDPLDKMAMTWNLSWVGPHLMKWIRIDRVVSGTPLPFVTSLNVDWLTHAKLTAFVNGGSLTGADPLCACAVQVWRYLRCTWRENALYFFSY